MTNNWLNYKYKAHELLKKMLILSLYNITFAVIIERQVQMIKRKHKVKWHIYIKNVDTKSI